jgi:hypothetical protein
VWVGAGLLIVLSGCAFDHHRADLQGYFSSGGYEQAAAALDEGETEGLYGDKNRLLWWLDRGAVALALDDHEQAIELLERAEAFMESNHGPGALDEAGRWLLNDTAVAYTGEPYEEIYVNVLKLLAQLERGVIDGGATVEARRLAGKADVLRDRYLEFREAVYSQGGQGFGDVARSSGGLVAQNLEGEFIESTLGTYLTAVTFMASGDYEYQRVAARRLLDSIRLQAGLIGPVRAADFEGLGERSLGPANLLVVALSGRGPTKDSETFGPIPVFDWPVYFQIPVLRGGGSDAVGARVVLARADGPPPAGGEAYSMALVEDMAAVATENHRRQLPLIYARTLLRSSLKAGASFAVTRSVRQAGNEGWSAVAAVIGGLAAVALTERADLRSWVFLPAQAHVTLLEVQPGEHRVRVEYLSAGGGVLYATPWETVRVPDPSSGEELATLVEHYWR